MGVVWIGVVWIGCTVDHPEWGNRRCSALASDIGCMYTLVGALLACSSGSCLCYLSPHLQAYIMVKRHPIRSPTGWDGITTCDRVSGCNGIRE